MIFIVMLLKIKNSIEMNLHKIKQVILKPAVSNIFTARFSHNFYLILNDVLPHQSKTKQYKNPPFSSTNVLEWYRKWISWGL